MWRSRARRRHRDLVRRVLRVVGDHALSADLVAAAAPICGMADLAVDYHATRPDLRPYGEMMGGPEEVPDRYRERSPVNFVENIRGELLIVQGLRTRTSPRTTSTPSRKPSANTTFPTSCSYSKTRGTASRAPRT